MPSIKFPDSRAAQHGTQPASHVAQQASAMQALSGLCRRAGVATRGLQIPAQQHVRHAHNVWKERRLPGTLITESQIALVRQKQADHAKVDAKVDDEQKEVRLPAAATSAESRFLVSALPRRNSRAIRSSRQVQVLRRLLLVTNAHRDRQTQLEQLGAMQALRQHDRDVGSPEAQSELEVPPQHLFVRASAVVLVSVFAWPMLTRILALAVALMTQRIKMLTEHLIKNPKDVHNTRGVRLIVVKRRKMLQVRC